MIINDIPAAGHRPHILHNATRGSVELQEQLLEPDLRDGRELAIKPGGAARLVPRYNAELACDDPPTA